MFNADRRTRAIAGLTAAGTTVVFAALSVLTGGFIVVPVLGSIDVAAGLAVPLGLYFGAPAAIGIAGGVVLSAAVDATLSWWTLFDAITYGVVGILAFRLWGTLPGRTGEQSPSFPAQWLEFVAVTGIVVTIAASTLAWGAVVAWASAFHTVALPEWALLFRSTFVVGLPVFIVVSAVAESPITGDRQRLAMYSGAFWGGVVTPLVWFLIGITSSIVIDNRQLAIIGGALALSIVAVTYLPKRETESDDQPTRHPTPADS